MSVWLNSQKSILHDQNIDESCAATKSNPLDNKNFAFEIYMCDLPMYMKSKYVLYVIQIYIYYIDLIKFLEYQRRRK